MREIIKFTISREEENLHEESFVVPHELKTLYLDIKVPEGCSYIGFVVLRDETGAIRLQKLLGYGAQKPHILQLGGYREEFYRENGKFILVFLQRL